jgi:hypothetical protein
MRTSIFVKNVQRKIRLVKAELRKAEKEKQPTEDIKARLKGLQADYFEELFNANRKT